MSYIKTVMTQTKEGESPLPSGNVVTDGDTSTKDLPTRTGGKIPEVTYDQNAGVPGRLGKKGTE